MQVSWYTPADWPVPFGVYPSAVMLVWRHPNWCVCWLVHQGCHPCWIVALPKAQCGVVVVCMCLRMVQCVYVAVLGMRLCAVAPNVLGCVYALVYARGVDTHVWLYAC